MSYSTFVIVGAACWLAIGLILSLAMGRRGHDAFAWLILGTLFGPLGAIFAIQARGQEETRPELVAPHHLSGVGPVDVLAGIDGSSESRAALRAAFEILGPRLRRLTLATVVPFDSGTDRQRSARAHLEEAGALVAGGPRLEVLHGRAAAALLERATDDGYDLLVIGTRGAGASKALLGSTALDLARSAKVPVLLMGNGHPLGLEDPGDA